MYGNRQLANKKMTGEPKSFVWVIAFTMITCNNSERTVQTVSELIGFKRRLSPEADIQISKNWPFSGAAFGQERKISNSPRLRFLRSQLLNQELRIGV